MDSGLYKRLMRERPSQHPPEWRMFLEICSLYLEKYQIKNPVVVELGIWRNLQKKFWVQLFGAEHIGIDLSNRRSRPEIHGSTHNPETLRKLKKMLKGRKIDILFIDACHHYEPVKRDFEMYSPLCNGIVALHDIENQRDRGNWRREVWKFWDELREKAINGKIGEYEKYLFISINQARNRSRSRRVGLGMILKR